MNDYLERDNDEIYDPEGIHWPVNEEHREIMDKLGDIEALIGAIPNPSGAIAVIFILQIIIILKLWGTI